ncbi:rhamnogalacturonan acetylesterase [Anditalea andensis]|uniref:Rhamnogalacturonan acetylesterase n=1 Tax=Anditalea andensis TaxID=1048983 RepID=A0A074KUT9_9BACT|nr:rhamnogalacturonan acetylesterase [Anditalea andensis]KEO72644.1 rhamnogalacturonan acetylesterase [Anditalea andensis]
MALIIQFLIGLSIFSGLAKDKYPTIYMIGDSTMADKGYSPSNPEKGWGQVFPLYLNDDIRVQNHAVNGRSSKSFRDEGRWDVVIAQVQEGDYVIIQFGHNDQKLEDPTRYTDPYRYKENLRLYITEVIDKGGHPILATPIARRDYDERGMLVDTHMDYVSEVKALAAEMDIPLLDINKRTTELINIWGEVESKLLFLHFSPGQYSRFPKGVVDNTHLSPIGAFKVCDLVVEEINSKIPELTMYIKK